MRNDNYKSWLRGNLYSLGGLPFSQLKLSTKWLKKGKKSADGEKSPDFETFTLHVLTHTVNTLVTNKVYIFLGGTIWGWYRTGGEVFLKVVLSNWLIFKQSCEIPQVQNLWNWKCSSVSYSQIGTLCAKRSQKYSTPNSQILLLFHR